MLPIPRYKYYLSWLFDQTLLRTESPLHSQLSVVLSSGRLRLETPTAIYSFEDKYDVFFAPFQQMHIERKQLREVLILGFGLGSVALMLSNYFGQSKAHYTGIEIDPVIIDLAQQCLPATILQQTNLVQADALSFVVQNSLTYDLIAVDVFEDMTTPAAFRSADFLRRLYDQLNPAAYLCYNTLSCDLESIRASEQFFSETFQVLFPHAKVYHVAGNRLLVVQKSQ